MSTGLYLIARIAGRSVAFAAAEVDSVIDLGAVVPTPRAVSGVMGIAALRSRVVTVIDPRVVLGLPVAGPVPTRAVVGSIDGHLYAVLVDTLDDVADHVAGPLPAGVVLDDGWAAAGNALIDCDGDPVLVMALVQLVPGTAAIAA